MKTLFGNIGKKIKTFAAVLFALEIIGAVVTGISVGIDWWDFYLGAGIVVGGALVAWISGLLLYGFGELITNSAECAVHAKRMTEHLADLEKQLKQMEIPTETKAAEVPGNPVRSKPASAPEANPEQKANENGAITALGISVEDLPKRAGVRVSAVERTGLGAKAGLKVDDMIVSINDAEISCVKDIEQRSARWKVGYTVFLKLRRDGTFVNTSIKF